MSTSLSTYIPINCEFHDRLEDLATLRRPARVRYVGDDGAQQERTAIITDIYASKGAEYLALSSGDIVRLDQLVEVDGFRLADEGTQCALQ